MNSRTLFAVLCLAVLLFCPQGAGLHAEEAPAAAESALVVLNSVFCIDNQYYLSCSKEGELFSVQANAATPCLYQGKLLPISGLKTGSKCLISYADGRASSVLVLLMPETITYLYGMYYQYLDGSLYLTVPGGEM